MSEEILWGTWTCTKCGADNSGKDRACLKCGDERDHEELAAIRLDANASIVTDREEIRIAKIGPDWSCKACNVTVRGDLQKCPTCGAPCNATVEDLMWRAKTRAGDPLERALIIEQDGEDEGRAALKGQSTKPWYEGALGRAKSIREYPKAFLGVLIGIALIVTGTILYFGMRTHVDEGYVSSMKWEQHTYRMTWTQTTGSDWEFGLNQRAEVPPVNGRGEQAGVKITTCESRVHHQERYACGSHQEQRSRRVQSGSHQSCSTSSNRNGSFSRSCVSVPDYTTQYYSESVTDYCNRPIYHMYCYYNTQEWRKTEDLVASGEGLETRWPDMTPRALDKIGHNGSYTLSVTYTEDDKTDNTTELHPGSEAEYKTWRVNERVTVDVRGFGTVADVHKLPMM